MDDIEIQKTFQLYGAPRIPPILMYPDLKRLQSCIFLYQGYKSGHWCCIIRHPNSWEIFDPVGLYPDDPLDNQRIIPVRKKMEQLCREQESYVKVEYNDYPFQRSGRACGLWCILRFFYSHLSCAQFKKEFKNLGDVGVCRFFDRMDLLK